MSLQIRETPEKVIVTLTDTRIFDQGQADQIGQSLRDICRQADLSGKRVLVNLHRVQFMNSAMISILVGLHKFAKVNSLDVRFATSGDVLDVLRITRLTEIFPLDNDDPDLANDR
ncbi:MAG: STAS domain-containing protein [Planctomycetaceae bacterium]|jgi:anti-anti-sigma factor